MPVAAVTEARCWRCNRKFAMVEGEVQGARVTIVCRRCRAPNVLGAIDRSPDPDEDKRVDR